MTSRSLHLGISPVFFVLGIVLIVPYPTRQVKHETKFFVKKFCFKKTIHSRSRRDCDNGHKDDNGHENG